MASNLAQRLGFAAVAIPLALGVVWLGGWPLAALVTLVAVLGVRELFDIARAGGNTPRRTGGMVLAAVVPLAVQATLTLPGVGAWLATWWAGLLGGGMALWLSWLVATRAPSERPLAAISITLFAVAYAGALPS